MNIVDLEHLESISEKTNFTPKVIRGSGVGIAVVAGATTISRGNYTSAGAATSTVTSAYFVSY